MTNTTQEAIGKLADMLTPLNPEAADELKELWHEYDQAETTGAVATTTVSRPSVQRTKLHIHTIFSCPKPPSL